MTTPAIELDAVGKRYWKIQERSLLRSLVPLGPPNRSELRALSGIDLRVEPGESLGIMGRNGAGKSTLLRLLAGVTQPTTGTVTTRGRVAPLLSIGVGFHQEMTGRENVFVNGMLLGLSKSEIEACFDDIVDFADLSEFIDTPVKFYSSGMFMRLGFSVAIHVDPEILLIDEVLAVGDIGFRLRSFDRMRALQRAGTTIVFVSHWVQAIHMLCPRAICMHRGRIEVDGPTETAIARYHELLSTSGESEEMAPVHVVHRELLEADGSPVETPHQETWLSYRVVVRFARPVEGPQFFFRVLAEDGTLAYSMQTTLGDGWRSFPAGSETTAALTFRPRFGGGGTFRITMVVTNDDASVPLLHDQHGPSFFVPPRLGVVGVADLEASVVVDGRPRTDHQALRFENDPAAVEGG
ncbi:MAG: ATP-binding cassette domain-containing protein [Actinobacteria bacterium]|nr:ATP-binding cassette domain-containing protein [Actinomycetota bacterium]